MNENNPIHWDNLARAAYGKYRSRLPLTAVEWDRLSRDERIAWISAVQEAVDVYVAAALA